ncbi:MAG: hypothetical protein GFH25_541276n37 [Chloroflexi bacterium AL-N10]|nr:hypothetical protein [Chloroflexi bacterium AL-N1]NOK71118.1 hypothetical protein [Chloroflexi bacterium AL-N10]NOK77366.1 hypothetical protein [Chloroflexi bacterium AL-N5]
MMEYMLFYIGFSLLLIHEMDAIRQREWKLFIFLSSLREETAYVVFTALHIPLYILLFWGLFGDGSSGINHGLVVALDCFFIIHVVLHVLFIRHKDYQFKNFFSWVLILGAGIAGVVDLLI